MKTFSFLNKWLQIMILEIAVERDGVCGFCKLSPYGEMHAYFTWNMNAGYRGGALRKNCNGLITLEGFLA